MKTIDTAKFSVMLLIYILIQPVLDFLTGWQTRLMPHFGLTVGVVVRAIMLVVILFFIYLSIKQRSRPIDRYVQIYFILLAVVLLINLIVNKLNKPVFATFTEVAALFKSVHYLVILIGFYYVFCNLTKNQIQQLLPRIVYWAEMIINAVMLLAAVTRTGFSTYPQGKLGQTGWFNAGNELGAILAITFPLVILYAFQSSQQTGRYWSWLGVALAAVSVIMVGTKSCFYGMIIGLVFAFVYQFIFYKRKANTRKIKRNLLINFMLLCLITVGIAGTYPLSPVRNNSIIQAKIIKENQINKLRLLHRKKHHKKLDHYEKFLLKNQELGNPLLAKLLSGRTNYFVFNSHNFKKAPLSQKLFGMGYGSNYRKHPRTVEMDWFDLFFQFGIIGFVVIILPLLVAIVYLVFEFFRYFTSDMVQDNLLFYVAVAIGIFMSLLAGHVLNAPAVSIYFSMIVAYLVKQPAVNRRLFNVNNKTINNLL